MQIIDINIIPKLLKEGKYSKKDIINLLAEFLSSNYSIFGLHKYDEDFRASVYLAFLENADKLIDTYDEQHGCFFTFYFCFIKTLITTENRKKARKSIECEFIAEECQNQFYEFNQNYSTLTGSINYPSKIPFNYNKPQREDLAQIFLNENVSKRDKTILILALKSSFYITDEQIKKVSDLLKIDSNLLQDTIQDFKNDLLKKQDRRNIYESRRNKAYYFHKKYENQISKLIENVTESKNELTEKKSVHDEIWKRYNEKFKTGFLFLRPSNKKISNYFGVQERQISYYLISIKKEMEDTEEDK